MAGKLYILDLLEGLDEATYRAWIGLVSKERRNQLPRFRFRADAERSLAGEILARAALSFATGLPPIAFSFARGERGKPHVATPRGASRPEFNVSHSGRLVACVISPQPVGVDVEHLFSPDDALIRHVCSPGESRFVHGSGGLSVSAAFTLLWTLKESYLKALGTGLCDDLPGIDLSPFLDPAETQPWKFSFSGHRFQAFFRRSHAISVCERLQN